MSPVGLLVTHPEVIKTILKDDFLLDLPKSTSKADVSNKRTSSEYELYVPPEVLEELKNKSVG